MHLTLKPWQKKDSALGKDAKPPVNLIIEDLINGTLKGTREFFKFEGQACPKLSGSGSVGEVVRRKV